MTQFEKYGVTDTYQLEQDVVILRGTIVAIKKLENGPWVLRADLLRDGDDAPRIDLPRNIRDALCNAEAVAAMKASDQ